jgi:hypothetical protein
VKELSDSQKLLVDSHTHITELSGKYGVLQKVHKDLEVKYHKKSKPGNQPSIDPKHQDDTISVFNRFAKLTYEAN